MRKTLLLFGFFLFGIGSSIINFLIFPFVEILVKKNIRKKTYSFIIYKSWQFFISILKILKILKVNISKNDRDKLKQIKNKIIVSTHPSLVDVVILMSLIPNSTCYAKKELAKNPILKNIMNSIFITNDVELSELREQSKLMMDEGFNLIIFPSGIRHRKKEFPKIKKGAAILAQDNEKNIFVIQMFTDIDFLQINQPIFDFDNKTPNFYVKCIGEIDINDYNSQDEVSKRKQITKDISAKLYTYIE